MKVLLVLHQLQAGGAEVMALDLARGLTDEGVQCVVAALHSSPGDTVLNGVYSSRILGGGAHSGQCTGLLSASFRALLP